MDDIKRHYEVLGLELGASTEDIKKAYYRLAHIWHPDRYAHNPPLRKIAEQNMKEINVAYERLSKFQPMLRPEPVRPAPRKSTPPSSPVSNAPPPTWEPSVPSEPWVKLPQWNLAAWPWRSVILAVLFIAALGFLIFVAQN